MAKRWNLSPQERENLRMRLGQILVGPEYNPDRPLGEQLLERLGGSGPTYQGPLMRLLGSKQPKKEQSPEELYPMPPDYAGGIEEWNKLSLEERKYVWEMLKAGKRVYLAVPPEEGQRGKLGGITMEKQRLQKVLTTEW